jgi:NTE family protein
MQTRASEGPLPESLTRGMFGQGGDRPNIFGVMTTSPSIMQDRLTRSRLAGDPPDVHVTPRVGHIGLLEFERADEAIRAGEIAVERKRPEFQDALEVMGLAIHR